MHIASLNLPPLNVFSQSATSLVLRHFHNSPAPRLQDSPYETRIRDGGPTSSGMHLQSNVNEEGPTLGCIEVGPSPTGVRASRPGPKPGPWSPVNTGTLSGPTRTPSRGQQPAQTFRQPEAADRILHGVEGSRRTPPLNLTPHDMVVT